MKKYSLAELYAAAGLGTVERAERELVALGLIQWGLAMRAFLNRGSLHTS